MHIHRVNSIDGQSKWIKRNRFGSRLEWNDWVFHDLVRWGRALKTKVRVNRERYWRWWPVRFSPQCSRIDRMRCWSKMRMVPIFSIMILSYETEDQRIAPISDKGLFSFSHFNIWSISYAVGHRICCQHAFAPYLEIKKMKSSALSAVCNLKKGFWAILFSETLNSNVSIVDHRRLCVKTGEHQQCSYVVRNLLYFQGKHSIKLMIFLTKNQIEFTGIRLVTCPMEVKWRKNFLPISHTFGYR